MAGAHWALASSARESKTVANQHEPKPTPRDKSPGHAPKDPPEGDPAPVAVAGPEAQQREKPQPADNAEPEGDPAPVAVAGPEAQAREKE